MSVINSNLQSLASSRELDRTPEALGRSLSRLAAGAKPALLSEDVTGAALAEKFDAQGERIRTATTDLQNATSSLQSSGGFMDGIAKALSLMDDLSQTAKDAAPTDLARHRQQFAALQEQLRQTIGGTTAEIGGTSDVAPLGTFNDVSLFGGDSANSPATAGPDANIPQVNLRDGAMGAIIQQDASGNFVLDVNSPAIADAIARASADVSAERASVGAAQSNLGLAASALAVEKENLNAVFARIGDADAANEATRDASNKILAQSGAAVQAQSQLSPQAVLKVLED